MHCDIAICNVSGIILIAQSNEYIKSHNNGSREKTKRNKNKGREKECLSKNRKYERIGGDETAENKNKRTMSVQKLYYLFFCYHK